MAQAIARVDGAEAAVHTVLADGQAVGVVIQPQGVGEQMKTTRVAIFRPLEKLMKAAGQILERAAALVAGRTAEKPQAQVDGSKGEKMDNVIDQLEANSVNSIMLLGKELSIKANLTLHELYQNTGQPEWYNSGKTSRLIILADDTVILRIPKEENGEYVWVEAKIIEAASKHMPFFKGDSTNPGPARRFAASRETARVMFDLFGKSWKITDLGAVKINGDCDIARNRDQLYYVIATQHDEWMLYLDARIGEAKGTGAMIIGKAFNPSVDITNTL